MKKAKILLACIAMFSILGGTAALKARDLSKVVFGPTTVAPFSCTVPLKGFTTIPNVNPAIVIAATLTPSSSCSLIVVYSTL